MEALEYEGADMTDMPILTQAVRNVITHEWEATYTYCGGMVPAAKNAYRHVIEWPDGGVVRRIRGEYRRLLQAESNIIEFPASEVDQLIGSGVNRI
jgi:hypothetical protein